jgi:hypothetical protein
MRQLIVRGSEMSAIIEAIDIRKTYMQIGRAHV